MGDLQRQLLALRPRLAQAATAVLQDWQPEDEHDEFGGGGACDAVASALAQVVAETIADIEITDSGQDGDDHAWIVVRLGRETYGIDVPPGVYESGGGYSWTKIADRVEPQQVEIFQSWWPDDQEYGVELEHKITAGTVTLEDFNQLIETSRKSSRERVQRRTRPIDGNRMTDQQGHSRIAPPNQQARLAPRPGGGAMNDPRRTSRGRTMLRRQATRFESRQDRVTQLLDVIRQYATADDLYGLWWHPQQGQLRVSNGDWAEYDTLGLKQALQQLLGDDRVEMDAEIGAPEGEGWDQLELEPAVREDRVREVGESAEPTAYPRAGFKFRRQYEAVCPHCREIMYEKSVVADPDYRESVREALSQLPRRKPSQLFTPDDRLDHLGPSLYRHRPCFDQGPFTIDWPAAEGYEEATQFLQQHHGEPVSEQLLRGVRNPGALRRLATRLLREHTALDREWLYRLQGIIRDE